MRGFAVFAGLVSTLLFSVGGTVVHAAASGGTWGQAQEVPGTAALNTGGQAEILSVSCGSPGNCSTGGAYADSHGGFQAFVASETDGTWRTARKVPGLAALNIGDNAEIISVSCASAGNCGAVGDYADSHGRFQAFVVSQVSGTWEKAEEVPGLTALDKGGTAFISAVSCASAGNCSAGGDYTGSHGLTQAFVVSQAHGSWGKAQEVPGLAALNTGGLAVIFSLSCGAVGDCSAGGYYSDSSADLQAYVVSQAHGSWGKAQEVPGLAALNTGGLAETNSVSCGAAAHCSAGGLYEDSSGHTLAFIVNQARGTWRIARNVPGLSGLNTGGSAETDSVSCASAGNCGAGGGYAVRSGHTQAFVVSRTDARWGKAEKVPGLAALNTGRFAGITSVSCVSEGNCSAVGGYTVSHRRSQAFVVGESGGVWGKAEEVPGLAALNTGGHAEILSVSCASAGHCSAAGSYKDSSGHIQVFVVSES